MKVTLLLLAWQGTAGWWLFGNFFHNRRIRNMRLQVSETGIVSGVEHLLDGPYGASYYETLRTWKMLSLSRQYKWWQVVAPKQGKYMSMWGHWVCPYEAKLFSQMYGEWRADPGNWVWIPEEKYKCITRAEARKKALEYATRKSKRHAYSPRPKFHL